MWFVPILFISPVLFDILKIRLIHLDQSTKFSVSGHSHKFPDNETASKAKYTFEEMVSLEKFRPIALEILKENRRKPFDSYLLRWLRDSGLDVDASAMRLTEAQIWRKRNGMENILNETIFEFKDKPIRLEGTDKEGNPIVIMTLKGHDIRKYIMAGQREKIVRYMYQLLERIEDKIWQLSRRTGKEISQCVMLLNGNGYNLKDHGCLNCLSVYLNFFQEALKYYPQFYKYAVVINAPTVAKPFVDLVMKGISEYPRRATKVFGARKEEFATYLLKIISSHQLPVAFGGEKQLN